MEFAGFWKRFGALWVDFFILAPLSIIVLWLDGKFKLFQVCYFLPGVLFGFWYHVYLVKKYGGTPGKRLLKIRIVKTDGSPVEYREALIRYSVECVISVALGASFAIATLRMSDGEYYSLGIVARSTELLKHAPFYDSLNLLQNIWIWSEFIIMLTNKRRRAAHDFIAGTVVVRDPLPEISSGTVNPG